MVSKHVTKCCAGAQLGADGRADDETKLVSRCTTNCGWLMVKSGKEYGQGKVGHGWIEQMNMDMMRQRNTNGRAEGSRVGSAGDRMARYEVFGRQQARSWLL